MASTIDEARTPAELAEWLRVWANGYEDGDALDDNDARQIADAVERVCAPCNAAAMREALRECRDELYEIQGMSELDDTRIALLRQKSNAALAAPPRNCDRFATAEEAYSAWMPAVEMDTICDWLFAPAQEGKEARRG